jgi:hypothetical protein
MIPMHGIFLKTLGALMEQEGESEEREEAGGDRRKDKVE